MLSAFLLEAIVTINRAQQVLDVVHKALAVCEATKQLWLSAVWTFWFALFDPGAKTVLTGQFAAGWAHPRLLDVLEADVALKKGDVLVTSTH